MFFLKKRTGKLERCFCTSVISLGRQTGKLSVEQLPRLYSVFVLGSATVLTVRGCGHRAVWSCSLLQGSTLGALHCGHCTVNTPQHNCIGVCSCGGQLWFSDNTVVSVEDAHSQSQPCICFSCGRSFSTAPRLWLACFRGLLCSYFISIIKSAPHHLFLCEPKHKKKKSLYNDACATERESWMMGNGWRIMLMAWRSSWCSLMSGRSVSAASLDPDTVPSQQEMITPHRLLPWDSCSGKGCTWCQALNYQFSRYKFWKLRHFVN